MSVQSSESLFAEANAAALEDDFAKAASLYDEAIETGTLARAIFCLNNLHVRYSDSPRP